MVQKFRSIVLIVVGIIALGLSFKCFSIDDLDYASKSMYGGDAYTGIQNAAAIKAIKPDSHRCFLATVTVCFDRRRLSQI